MLICWLILRHVSANNVNISPSTRETCFYINKDDIRILLLRTRTGFCVMFYLSCISSCWVLNLIEMYDLPYDIISISNYISSWKINACYVIIKIVHRLNLTSLKNEKAQFNVALRRHLIHIPFTLFMNFLCFRMIRNFYSSWYCIISVYSVCFEYLFCMCDLLHILLSFWQGLGPIWFM